MAEATLVLGSWNIENLGGQGQQKPAALARHLRLAGADVLALQEIHDTGPGLSNRRLDQALRLLNQERGQDWAYELYPNKTPNDTQRLCGVAWNRARVRKLGSSFRIPIEDDPSDDYDIWHRHPQATAFGAVEPGLTDFVLVSLHHKSNRRPKGKAANFTRLQRGLEAQTLVAQLAAVSAHYGSEKDLVLAGDTNCLDAGELCLRAYRAAGFRDLNLLDLNTHLGNAPFDRFLVPHAQPEFRDSYQLGLTPSDRRHHDGQLSDHFLILTTIRLMPDDD